MSTEDCQDRLNGLLCDQQAQRMDHLMTQCATARSIWFQLLVDDGLHLYSKQDNTFWEWEWWFCLTSCQPKCKRREVASLSIACCRRLWLERSNRNFERGLGSEGEFTLSHFNVILRWQDHICSHVPNWFSTGGVLAPGSICSWFLNFDLNFFLKYWKIWAKRISVYISTFYSMCSQSRSMRNQCFLCCV
jgi:hypothetical protein